MAGTLNLKELKDEPILFYENALSYVFSNSRDDNKKDVPACVIYPNENIKIGFPIYSIKNINKNENLINDTDVQTNRFNEEPLITYASESKYIYPIRVKIYYCVLYMLIISELFAMIFFKDNINRTTTGEINRGQVFVFLFMALSHILVILSKFRKIKPYVFDLYTSLSLFFFILSILTINCFSSSVISVLQFFIFFFHAKIDYYVMAHSCVVPP